MSAVVSVIATGHTCANSTPLPPTRAVRTKGRTVTGEASTASLPGNGLGLVRHAHHWLIARQNGPTSEGVCKSCDARRSFDNGFVGSYASRIQPRQLTPVSGIKLLENSLERFERKDERNMMDTVMNNMDGWTSGELLAEVLKRNAADMPALRRLDAMVLHARLAESDRQLPMSASPVA